MKSLNKSLIGLILLVFVECFAAPQPAVVPGPNIWTLDVLFGEPQQITINLPNTDKPQRFWYIIITLTNNTGKTADFYPACELMTDTFKIIPAYKDTTGLVFKKIKERHAARYPLLESLEYADNRILEGSDNARDMVIIWPDFDARARQVSLFIEGLSNETASVLHPTQTDENGNPIRIFLRKSLELQYTIPGDAAMRGQSRMIFLTKNWVMR